MNTPRAIAETEPALQYYPTPDNLISQLITPYYSTRLRVLEPSAGRGNIVARLVINRNWEVSCCEISADFRAILVDKGYKVIGADFLELVAPYSFGLIVMNPPFRYGVQHVLKAWSMLDDDGSVASVLPKTALYDTTGPGLQLAQLIELFGTVEDVGRAFNSSERPTGVECIIVRLKKPASSQFNPFEGYIPNTDPEDLPPEDRDLPAPRDLIKAIVQQYDAASRALKAWNDAEQRYYQCVPDSLRDYKVNGGTYNERIDKCKAKFWQIVFDRTRIGADTTSEYRKKFYVEQERLARMEFSERTIYGVLDIYMKNREAIRDECILKTTEELLNYSRDNADPNLQWATNKGSKLNGKIILPNTIDNSGGFHWHIKWTRTDIVDDLDKVLAMFGGTNGVSSKKSIDEHLRTVDSFNYDQKFEVPNFYCRVFLKGTLHLWFKDLDALKEINRYIASRKLRILGSGR